MEASSNDISSGSPPWTHRWGERLRRLAILIVMAGIITRLTFRDLWLGFSTIFYATPLGLLILGSLFCAVATYFLQKNLKGEQTPTWNPATWSASIWGLMALGLLLHWWQSEWRWNNSPPPLKPDEVTVLFWNLGRKWDLTQAAAYIREANPDIVGLVEVIGNGEDRRAFWKEQLPEYDVSILGAGLELLTKGSSGEATAVQLGRHSLYRQLQVQLRGNSIECFVVDIESSPFRSRRQPLKQLAEAVNQYREPVVIMGDFNTPTDSYLLEPLQAQHTLTFNQVGRGYQATWPLYLPVLTLDQIWINERVVPLDCYHGVSLASDHRPVHVRIRISP